MSGLSGGVVVPTVLITGASKGIGRDIAIRLAKTAKYKLALLSRNETKLKETVHLCRNAYQSIETRLLVCDITDSDALKQQIDACESEFGPLCVLINNAGVLYKHHINPSISLSKIDQSLDVNVRSVIHACSFSMDYLIRNKELHPDWNVSVINISSIAGTLRGGSARISLYGATKFAVRGFGSYLFAEIGDKHGIKVCTIMPGFVNTEMVTDVSHPGSNAQKVRQKMMSVSDVSSAVEFALNCSQGCCPLEILLCPQNDVFKQLVIENEKLNASQKSATSKL